MIVIGAKYTHNEKGGEYVVKYPAICKDRDIAVVIYSDPQGNIYTRSTQEFQGYKTYYKKTALPRSSFVTAYATAGALQMLPR